MSGVAPTRTVVVWCADWPAAALGRPPDAPVVVLHANRVVSVSPPAREAGVEIGARRREAQRHCPEAELVERDPDREAVNFEPVLAALDPITPRVEITMAGTCRFPARGPSRYFGGDAAMAERVAAAAATALRAPAVVGVGVADGAFAAERAARRAAVAGGGWLVIDAGASPEFLAPISVRSLGIPELADVLERLGLRTLGAFADLPAADVTARFGTEGAAAHAVASGVDLVPLHLADPPPDLDVDDELDPPLDRVDRAAFVAKALADDLNGRLESRGLAAVSVLIGAETADGTLLERRWRHDGALSSAAVAQRVRWQLDGWLTWARGRGALTEGGIVRLWLRPEQVAPARGRQLGFWGGADAASMHARRGLARVQALLGEDAVRVAEWQGGRSPADRYRLVPIDTVPVADDESLAVRTAGPEPWPGHVPDPPPALVWPVPRRAELVDDEGRRVEVNRRGAVSCAPARLSIASGPWLDVVGWVGPWLVDERWWDAVGHRRRARFQIAAGDGTAHLLALEAQHWWVEATYD